ncbi:MAG: terminase gpA endonuclease subunit [Planctomycetota bacterium]
MAGKRRDDDAAKKVGRRRNDSAAARSRENSSAVSDVGEIPKVRNKRRRQACEHDLHKFLTTYFPNSTGMRPLSDDHRKVIATIEACVLQQGRFVNAVYRGFAKTTILLNAIIWAALYGHRRFLCVFGLDQEFAANAIESIRMELETNELLAADFPEVCHPIRALEGKAQRCASQTAGGKPTHIEWAGDKLVLPTVENSVASGAVIKAFSLQGRSRGPQHRTSDGTVLRPDFIAIDDPQENDLASNPDRVRRLLYRIKTSIAKSCDHSRQLSMVVNATVIAPRDLIEQLIDTPGWQWLRIPMVKSWADEHEKLWLGEYQKRRHTFDPEKPGDQARAAAAATKYYKRNRRRMNAGADVSWAECYDRDSELSAIQHAYNLLIDDGEAAFNAEYQQNPSSDDEGRGDVVTMLPPAAIDKKRNGLERGVVPLWATKVVAYIDVQKNMLWYVVLAADDDFRTAVIDYGPFPRQPLGYVTKKDLPVTLAEYYGPGLDQEALWDRSLDELSRELVDRPWPREAGDGDIRCSRPLVDANYGDSTARVFEVARRRRSRNITPAHGRGITAANAPMRQWPFKPGEKLGPFWCVKNQGARRGVRAVIIDTNTAKTFTHRRIATPVGNGASLELFGDPDRDRRLHEMFADHMHAEAPVEHTAKGRTVVEWELKPNRPDNDLFDCTVGAMVAASMEGSSLPGSRPRAAKKKKKAKPKRKFWGGR